MPKTALKLPYANMTLVATAGGRVAEAKNVKRHGDIVQTHRAARAGGRVGGDRCYRLTAVTDVSSAKNVFLTRRGMYYGVTVPGARGTMTLAKNRAAAVELMRTYRKSGRSQIFLLTPVSAE